MEEGHWVQRRLVIQRLSTCTVSCEALREFNEWLSLLQGMLVTSKTDEPAHTAGSDQLGQGKIIRRSHRLTVFAV